MATGYFFELAAVISVCINGIGYARFGARRVRFVST